VIPTIISQALNAPAIRLGSLNPSRDLNYVTDTVAGFLAVAQSEAAVGEVVNIGSGSTITIGDLAALTLRILGADKPIIADPERVRPENSEVLMLLADNHKAEALTGWRPRVGLEQGLRETIEFVRRHGDRFRPDIYNR
jgi:nucleoside-diphosphate-sugar epimerase